MCLVELTVKAVSQKVFVIINNYLNYFIVDFKKLFKQKAQLFP